MCFRSSARRRPWPRCASISSRIDLLDLVTRYATHAKSRVPVGTSCVLCHRISWDNLNIHGEGNDRRWSLSIAGMDGAFISSTRRFTGRKLRHLQAKRRADTLTLIAGPSDDPWPRARFRLLTKQRWTLDVADAAGRWEPTPFQASLRDLLDLVADTFPWVLSDL